MNMPGFTAELSLYQTNGRYSASQVSPAAEIGQGANFQLVTPQFPTWCSRCRVACYGRYRNKLGLLEQCLEDCGC